MVSLLMALITVLNPSSPYEKNVLFLVDVSGSIGDTEIKAAIDGFRECNNVPLDDYNFTAWAFDCGLYKYPGGWQQSSPLAVNDVVEWIKKGRKDWRGNTNIVPALAATVLDLKKKTIVVITDGFFNEPEGSVAVAIKKIKDQIGFIGIGEKQDSLYRLAKAGGGGYRVTEKRRKK